jgi:hypothetical protein
MDRPGVLQMELWILGFQYRLVEICSCLNQYHDYLWWTRL